MWWIIGTLIGIRLNRHSGHWYQPKPKKTSLSEKLAMILVVMLFGIACYYGLLSWIASVTGWMFSDDSN